MIFNYKRVSTLDQNTERQLVDVACDREYEDKLSGKDTNRPELNALLSNLRPGDVVNVHSLDRLARNVKDLLELVETIVSKGATVNFKKEGLTFGGDDTNPFQRLMLSMLGAIAEFERALILERQKEGIAIAKAKGKYKGGRGKTYGKADVEEMRKMYVDGASITQIARHYKVTRQTIYNYLELK